MKHLRSSGILLHISSLPSPYGIGDFGPGAYRFADFLQSAGQHLWQILPLTPINTGNTSPYTSASAFATNTFFLSPDLLKDHGLLTPSDLASLPAFSDATVSYTQAIAFKEALFRKIPARLQSHPDTGLHCAYDAFCQKNDHWLDDYATYRACERYFKALWNQWPEEIRDRTSSALKKIKEHLTDQITVEKTLQFLTSLQWQALKQYCNDRAIQIIGDLPYCVDYYSADVWANPDIFKLNPDKTPQVVSGVPPDYFSKTGQLWKNPVYHWKKPATYMWWIARLAQAMTLYDLIRIDHFRGFAQFWEVPAKEETAKNGAWEPGPGALFFDRLFRRLPGIQLVAEDLGYITADVRELRAQFHLPGMKVLQFAFFDDPTKNPYLPYNVEKNAIIYTGTHDNNTIRGWYEKETDPTIRQRINDYTAENVTADTVHWVFIRLAHSSVADKAVIPMQDLLGLGEDARMNTPSRSQGNWTWRVSEPQLSKELADILNLITKTYGRTEPPIPQE